MFARLGFSVAVAVEPDILLVDEVLAVGDEQFQRRCAEKMSELRSGGRTVVLVSHGLGQVQQLCDQAVWLDKGGVQIAGDTERRRRRLPRERHHRLPARRPGPPADRQRRDPARGRAADSE